MKLVCIGCGKTPAELPEYVECARLERVSPDLYVQAEEGTLNPANGHFACTPCYVAMGCPASPTGWVAP